MTSTMAISTRVKPFVDFSWHAPECDSERLAINVPKALAPIWQFATKTGLWVSKMDRLLKDERRIHGRLAKSAGQLAPFAAGGAFADVVCPGLRWLAGAGGAPLLWPAALACS